MGGLETRALLLRRHVWGQPRLSWWARAGLGAGRPCLGLGGRVGAPADGAAPPASVVLGAVYGLGCPFAAGSTISPPSTRGPTRPLAGLPFFAEASAASAKRCASTRPPASCPREDYALGALAVEWLVAHAVAPGAFAPTDGEWVHQDDGAALEFARRIGGGSIGRSPSRRRSGFPRMRSMLRSSGTTRTLPKRLTRTARSSARLTTTLSAASATPTGSTAAAAETSSTAGLATTTCTALAAPTCSRAPRAPTSSTAAPVPTGHSGCASAIPGRSARPATSFR